MTCLQREFHVPQPDHISALPVADPEALDEDLQDIFALCTDVLHAYSRRPQKSCAISSRCTTS
jgi:hypothetical protein